MDVERIQKVNDLALDLMKKGLARDREDAIAQAEKVFRNRDTEDYTSLRQTMAKQPEARKEQEISLSQESIQEILQKNTTFLVNTLRSFTEKITVLEKEVSELKGKIARQTFSSANTSSVQPTQEIQPKTSSNHPRSGSYKQDDVSIEKFFYMGKK